MLPSARFPRLSLQLAFVAVLIPVATLSQSTFDGTTVGDYLDRALTSHPALHASAARHAAAASAVPLASAWPEPRIQATRFVESPQTRTGPQRESIALMQTLPWFGRKPARTQAAVANADAHGHAYENDRLQRATRVAHMFYEYGFTAEATRLTSESVALLRGLEPIVEEGVRAGGDLNSLLRLKVEIGRVEDRLQSLTETRSMQSARLRQLLFVEDSTEPMPWPSWHPPESHEPDWADETDIGLTDHPSLRRLDSVAARAQAERESAQLRAYPDVTVGLTYTRVGDPVVNPATPGAGADPWGVSVAMNLPVWFGANRSAVAAAQASWQAVQYDREALHSDLVAQLRSSRAALSDARRRLQLYGDDLLGLAQQALENSRASYQTGGATILEVIDSERSLLELQLLYWRAAADAWQQRIAIEALTGRPFVGIHPVTGAR